MRTEQEAVSEINRELQVRRRCYDRWIADGKLDGIDATDRMERLEAALVICQRAVDMKDATAAMASRVPSAAAVVDAAISGVMTPEIRARRSELGLPV